MLSSRCRAAAYSASVAAYSASVAASILCWSFSLKRVGKRVGILLVIILALVVQASSSTVANLRSVGRDRVCGDEPFSIFTVSIFFSAVSIWFFCHKHSQVLLLLSEALWIPRIALVMSRLIVTERALLGAIRVTLRGRHALDF